MAQPSMPQQAQGHDDNDIKVGTRIESENTAVRQQIFDAMLICRGKNLNQTS